MKNEKVLIIDDEKDICQLLSALLKKEGKSTTYANTLNEGKQKIVEFNPQIIFLDLNLPDGAGFSIIPYIKSYLPNASIVIISAYDGQKEREYATKEFAIKHFLGKPLNKKLILETIATINQ
tara:strand:+ start:1461 stop:1826 length:366 start_codon:yes stop_codon:yes gene_type:complete